MSSDVANALGVCDPLDFCRACACFATGIGIVTVCGPGGQPHGMTVNSFTSVSLDPLLFLVCIDARAGIRPLLHSGAAIAVNLLDEQQQALSVRFARQGEDRFGAQPWNPGVDGAPLIPGCLAAIEGRIRDMIPAGDHTIVVAEVRATSYREGRPLVYFNSRYRTLGDSSV